MTAERRELVVPGGLVGHQLTQWLMVHGITYSRERVGTDDRFWITAGEETWDQVQAWVEKVTT